MPGRQRMLRMTPEGELIELSTGGKLLCALHNFEPCNAKLCSAFQLEDYRGLHARCIPAGRYACNDLGLLEADSVDAFKKGTEDAK